MKINRLTKLFIKFSPKGFLKYTARSQAINPSRLDYAEKLFRDCRRIDIQPLSGSHRGFIIFLDNKFSLWFYQDGDHFVFDGYEMGEYDDGEVTVFDGLKWFVQGLIGWQFFYLLLN